MPACVIVDIEVTDPAVHEECKTLAPASLAIYRGRNLARGGPTQVLEGNWTPRRLVVLEFPDPVLARQWLESPEYRPARKIRHKTARTNMVLIEGVSSS